MFNVIITSSPSKCRRPPNCFRKRTLQHRKATRPIDVYHIFSIKEHEHIKPTTDSAIGKYTFFNNYLVLTLEMLNAFRINKQLLPTTSVFVYRTILVCHV